jgi:hypothetical protein
VYSVLFLADFNQKESGFVKQITKHNFVKIYPAGGVVFHTDRHTNILEEPNRRFPHLSAKPA